jgi:hypothetical protein
MSCVSSAGTPAVLLPRPGISPTAQIIIVIGLKIIPPRIISLGAVLGLSPERFS